MDECAALDPVGLQTYRQIFHASPDSISITRFDDGAYLDVNPGFERFTGYRRDEVLGRNAIALGFWPDLETRQRIIDTLLARGGQIHAFPTRMRIRNGATRNVEVSASLTEANGERIFVAIVRDVTERMHDAVELQQYREHLEVLVRARAAALHRSNTELLDANRQLAQAHQRLLETERRLRHMALHDALTGLPNRALLHDRIHQAIVLAEREGSLMALLFLDLDRFKHVNDSLGHAVGDALLHLVATRLSAAVRRCDTVGRLGGDEFLICLTQLHSPDHAAQLAGKLLAALEPPFEVQGQILHVHGSIGISVFPEGGRDAEALLRAADTAMYHAKDKGRGNFAFYTSELNTAARRRLSLEAQLHTALERQEFVLHYQPQVEIRSGRIIAVEALVRWQQPERGLVSPLEFIPVAEETGLILKLGEWVLREACMQLKRWRLAGHGQLGVAVNLSARQIQEPDFPERVARVLRETGVPAAALDLELTESMLMQPVEENRATLERLAGMGVRLSIDDFGTGYSSLAYLRRFPIHALKIDRSFVHGITRDASDATITQTIIAMARTLGLSVIAEGVESPEQAALLASHGCALAQGYYYARPGDTATVSALLEARRLG